MSYNPLKLDGIELINIFNKDGEQTLATGGDQGIIVTGPSTINSSLTINPGNNRIKFWEGENSIAQIGLRDSSTNEIYLQGWGSDFRIAVAGAYDNHALVIDNSKNTKLYGDLIILNDGNEFWLKSTDYNLARIIPRGSSGANLDKGLFSLMTSDGTNNNVEKVRIDSAGGSWFDGGSFRVGAGNTTIRTTALGGSTAMADGTLIFGAGSTDYFSWRLDSGADLYLDKIYASTAANVFSIDRSTAGGDITFKGSVTTAQHLKATGGNLKFHAGGNHILNIDLNGKVYPQTDNAVDLGFNDSSFRFRNLYMTGTADIPSIYLHDYIYHKGDTDTYIRFQTDHITLRANAKDILNLGWHGGVSTNNTGTNVGQFAYAPDGLIADNLGGANMIRKGTDIAVQASAYREEVTFIDGTKVQAHTSTGNGTNTACYQWYTSENIKVNPEKDYEFSVWIKSTGDDYLYLGWHEFASNGNRITSNPYFHTNKIKTHANSNNTGTVVANINGWTKLTFKLKSHRTTSGQADSVADRNASSNRTQASGISGVTGVMHSTTSLVHLRLGTCYGSVNGSKSWFYNPKIIEAQDDDYKFDLNVGEWSNISDLNVSNRIILGPGTTGSPYDSNTLLHVKGTTRSVVQQSSTTDAYYMFGDAGANNAAWLGYNHSTGMLDLHSETSILLNKGTTIQGTLSVTGTNVTVSNATNPYIYLNDTNAGAALFQQEGNSTRIGSDSNTTVKIIQNNQDAITIDTSKNATFEGNVSGTRFILPSTASAANQWIYTNNTNTGTGSLTIQAGEGSAAYGGGLVLYSHAHASKPGWVKAGISSGSGGKFSVNTQGTGGGTDVFTVDASGNGTFTGYVTSVGLTVDYTGNRTGDAGILVTNDSSDWGIKVDKDGTTDYGILSQTDGDNAIVVRNAAGTTNIQLQGDGDATFAGAVTVNGNTILGDNTSDTHAISGYTSIIRNTAVTSGTTDSNNQLLIENTHASGSALLRMRGGDGSAKILYGENNSTDKFHIIPRNDTTKEFTLDQIGNATFAGGSHTDGIVRSRKNIVSNSTYNIMSLNSSRAADDYGGVGKDYVKMDLVTPGPNTDGNSSAHGFGSFSLKLANNAGSTAMGEVLNITAGGSATFAGSVTIDSDTAKLYLGADDDLHIYHTGTDGYVLNKTGDLYLTSQAHGGDIIFKTENSSGTAVTPLTLDSAGAATFAGANTYNKIQSYYSGSYISGWKFSDYNGGIWYDAGADDLTLNAGHANSQMLLNSGGAIALTLDSSQNATFAGEVKIEMAGPKLQLKPTTQNNASIIELGVLNGGTNAYARIDAINLSNYDSNLRFYTNPVSSTTQTLALTLDSSQNATFAGTINQNFSSGYAPLVMQSAHRETVSGQQSQTDAYGWWTLSNPSGYSNAGFASSFKVKIYTGGRHANGSTYAEFLVRCANGNHQGTGGLVNTEVTRLILQGMDDGYGGYSDNTYTFYYDNAADWNTGKIYIKVKRGDREPVSVVRVEPIGWDVNNTTYVPTLTGHGFGTDGGENTTRPTSNMTSITMQYAGFQAKGGQSGDARGIWSLNGAGNGAPHEMGRFLNQGSGATSSYLYVGATSGTDWRIGKNVLGTSGSSDFGIATHSGSTIALKIDNSNNTTFGGGIKVNGPGSYNTIKSTNEYTLGLIDSSSVTQWWFKTYTNGGFALHENGVGDQFTIAAGGNATFAGDITGSASIFNITNNDIRFKTSGAETMLRAVANGAVEIMYDNSTKLATVTGGVSVTGTMTASADVVAYSDERLKTNIKTLDGSKVYEMRGVSFIKDDKEGSGVIAQELEKIAPELVSNDNEYKAVAYGNITGYLIEAIKELKAEIEELKKQVK